MFNANYSITKCLFSLPLGHLGFSTLIVFEKNATLFFLNLYNPNRSLCKIKQKFTFNKKLTRNYTTACTIMPIRCHFPDCKALLVNRVYLTHICKYSCSKYPSQPKLWGTSSPSNPHSPWGSTPVPIQDACTRQEQQRVAVGAGKTQCMFIRQVSLRCGTRVHCNVARCCCCYEAI